MSPDLWAPVGLKYLKSDIVHSGSDAASSIIIFSTVYFVVPYGFVASPILIRIFYISIIITYTIHPYVYINLLVHALAYNQWLLTMSLPSGILMAILPMIFIKRKIFRNTINCWWRAEHNSLDFIFSHDFQKVAGTRNIVGIVSFK